MTLKKLNKFKTAFIFLALVFSGCGSQKNEGVRNDTVLDAYRLIDDQRSDEAIQLLETSLAQDPSKSEYKVVLASAYAHKAGIKIQKLVPLLTQSDKIKKLGEPNLNSPTAATTSQRVNASAQNIAKLLSKFSGFFEAYALIPQVSKDQATYLTHAVYLLNDIGSALKPEDVLYRAVLETVLLKYELAEGFIGELIEPETHGDKTCRLNLGNINDSVIRMGKLLIDICNDIGFVKPKEASDMKKIADQVSESVTNITMATTAVTVADEAANIFLKEAALQNGFGKIIKCGGD